MKVLYHSADFPGRTQAEHLRAAVDALDSAIADIRRRDISDVVGQVDNEVLDVRLDSFDATIEERRAALIEQLNAMSGD